MKTDDIVQAVSNFTRVRIEWGLPYPKKGDVLTIAYVEKHPNKKCRKMGIILLHFKELPGMTGICDKTIYGRKNFIKLEFGGDAAQIIENGVGESYAKIRHIALPPY